MTRGCGRTRHAVPADGEQVLHGSDEKGRRLAGPGLCLAGDVLARKRER
jgi:hypothetical protein